MQAAAAGSTTLQVVREVVRQDGFLGLYRGATPGVVRSSVLTATQCATYDEVKRYIINNFGWKDGIYTQLVTGLATGELERLNGLHWLGRVVGGVSVLVGEKGIA